MRVGIVGVGQNKFGKLSDSSSRELVADAFKEALSDAGIARNDISTIIVCSGSHYDKQRSPSGIMTEYVGLNPKPTFHVEAACASSGVGVRVGWSMIQAGLHDVVAVVGFQKMTELDTEEVQDVMSRSGDVMWESPFGPTMPAYYAMHARAHMNRYGTTEEQFALVSVKNHKYGAKNPYAMFQKELTVEDVLKSRVVASPLKLYDCCANADGATPSMFKDQAPYFLGLAELSDGPKVFAWIDKTIPDNQIIIGMKLKLEATNLANGNLCYTLIKPDTV